MSNLGDGSSSVDDDIRFQEDLDKALRQSIITYELEKSKQSEREMKWKRCLQSLKNSNEQKNGGRSSSGLTPKARPRPTPTPSLISEECGSTSSVNDGNAIKRNDTSAGVSRRKKTWNQDGESIIPLPPPNQARRSLGNVLNVNRPAELNVAKEISGNHDLINLAPSPTPTRSWSVEDFSLHHTAEEKIDKLNSVHLEAFALFTPLNKLNYSGPQSNSWSRICEEENSSDKPHLKQTLTTLKPQIVQPGLNSDVAIQKSSMKPHTPFRQESGNTSESNLSTSEGPNNKSTRSRSPYAELIDLINLHQINSNQENNSVGVLEIFDPLRKDEQTPKARNDNSTLGSCSSASTSGFAYQGSKEFYSTLYPDLNELELEDKNIYGNLNTESDFSVYEAYYPSEFVKTVSCSSPSLASSSIYETLSLQALQVEDELSRGSNEAQHGFVEPYATISLANAYCSPDASVSSKENVVNRTSKSTHEKSKRRGTLYENLENYKDVTVYDNEIKGFYDMLREVRLSCPHNEADTNKGYVSASVMEDRCYEEKNLSLKIIVDEYKTCRDPVAFTLDVTLLSYRSVIEIALQKFRIHDSSCNYMLRGKFTMEFLDSDCPLIDYLCVQSCIKLDQDPHFVLVHNEDLKHNSWARTLSDDVEFLKNVSIEKILPPTSTKSITYSELSSFLEVIDVNGKNLMQEINGVARTLPASKPNPIICPGLIQPVKGVCTLLGKVTTVELTDCLDSFERSCNEWNQTNRALSAVDSADLRRWPKISKDSNSTHSTVEIIGNNTKADLSNKIAVCIEKISDAVSSLVQTYSRTFPVSFKMNENTTSVRKSAISSVRKMSQMNEAFCVRVEMVQRVKPEWINTYCKFFIKAELCYGIKAIAGTETCAMELSKQNGNYFFDSLIFDEWVQFKHVPVCVLPREGRVVFTLYGQKPSEENVEVEGIELNWASVQCFDFNGLIVQGNYFLPMWPDAPQKRLGPAPNLSFSSDDNAPLLSIEFINYGCDVPFPAVPLAAPVRREFDSLDAQTKEMLKEAIEASTFTRLSPNEREILWEKRHYLKNFPNALPKVLLAAQLWDFASLGHLHSLLIEWAPLDPIDAVQLLLPCFPDSKVRAEGIRWISHMPDGELVNILPLLVEAMSYETSDLSPLARFLLLRSLQCIDISHAVFWLLVSQVGLGKWSLSSYEKYGSSDMRYIGAEGLTYDPKRRRLQLMLNALMIVLGKRMRSALVAEYEMIQKLYRSNAEVKAASSSSRNAVLTTELARISIQPAGSDCPFPLPLSPKYSISSIDTKNCSFFNSATLPLRISFFNQLPEAGTFSTLYKVGDDLRQDMLAIQAIRIIEKWWLKEGLDLRVITFSCIPTGYKQGMVEMIENAETLCRIQAEYGPAGPFKNRSISEWLAKMNPNIVDSERARENFSRSCAAYCVLTYVLGICDRHNDNIMLTKKGHLFHIDFGKCLGDAQMFGNFKRDRVPFVLTQDMVYVINKGEKSTSYFHQFVENCCKAFQIVRQNGNTLLNFFSLMSSAGMPGIDSKSLLYMQRALMPGYCSVEAAARFTRLIDDSSQNWFTSVNFFIHSLAQYKFFSDTDNPLTLSFSNGTYSLETDGRIEGVKILSFEKKFDQEKYYSYYIQVQRKDQPDSFVNRSYKEFLEFHSKLCINFPKAIVTLKTLPRGSVLGRSNVKQVAEKRMTHLQDFLDALFTLAPEISHSPLVYTFFHSLLRDEQRSVTETENRLLDRNSSVILRSPSRILGSVKVNIEYKMNALMVLIVHALELETSNGQLPSTYVKTYLQPDPYRATKRKTRVVKKNQHPVFMEVIEYRLPLNIVTEKNLLVSVWHHDLLQENNFLGGVQIPLRNLKPFEKIVETYKLGNITSP